MINRPKKRWFDVGWQLWLIFATVYFVGAFLHTPVWIVLLDSVMGFICLYYAREAYTRDHG